AEPVIDLFELGETGNQKLDSPRQVGRVAQHNKTLPQRVLDQVILMDVEIVHGFLQVSNPPVDHLGGCCGTAGREVAGLDNNRFEASQLCVQGAAGACGASPDHADIECA